MSTVYKGESLSVRVEERLTRSQTQRYEVVVRPEVSLCIPITREGRIVVIRQYRAATDEFVLEFPAGRLEVNEAAEMAAVRELKEETGFDAHRLEKIGKLLTAPHFSNEKVHLFLAWGTITESPSPTPREDIAEVMLLDAQALQRKIVDGALVDAKSLAAFAIALASGRSLEGRAP